jgi:hypothetical protein
MDDCAIPSASSVSGTPSRHIRKGKSVKGIMDDTDRRMQAAALAFQIVQLLIAGRSRQQIARTLNQEIAGYLQNDRPSDARD